MNCQNNWMDGQQIEEQFYIPSEEQVKDWVDAIGPNGPINNAALFFDELDNKASFKFEDKCEALLDQRSRALIKKPDFEYMISTIQEAKFEYMQETECHQKEEAKQSNEIDQALLMRIKKKFQGMGCNIKDDVLLKLVDIESRINQDRKSQIPTNIRNQKANSKKADQKIFVGKNLVQLRRGYKKKRNHNRLMMNIKALQK